jgi:hypothetical protein
MLAVLKAFWSAVAAVFPDAWDLPPKKSRLLDGAGAVVPAAQVHAAFMAALRFGYAKLVATEEYIRGTRG